MARDDSILYSGASSASFKDEKKQEKASERSEVRLKLLPAKEIIDEEFKSTYDQLANIEFADLDAQMSQDNFKAVMLGRKYAIKHLRQLKTRLDNKLRNNKKLINE